MITAEQAVQMTIQSRDTITTTKRYRKTMKRIESAVNYRVSMGGDVATVTWYHDMDECLREAIQTTLIDLGYRVGWKEDLSDYVQTWTLTVKW